MYNEKKGKRCSKKESNWVRPYAIHLVNEKRVVSLKKYNGKVLCTEYNVKLLKRFKDRNISTPETNDIVSDETDTIRRLYHRGGRNDRYFYPVDKIWQRKTIKHSWWISHWIGTQTNNKGSSDTTHHAAQDETGGNCFFWSICYATTGSKNISLEG